MLASRLPRLQADYGSAHTYTFPALLERDTSSSSILSLRGLSERSFYETLALLGFWDGYLVRHRTNF